MILTQVLKTNVLFLFLSLFMGATSQAGSRPYTLVSDIDDTIKVSHVDSFFDLIRRGLFTPKVFPGTQVLFQELARSAEGVVYLSRSPAILESNLKKFLISDFQFPAGEFVLNQGMDLLPNSNFKEKKLDALVQSGVTSLLLFGDDTEQDPQTYEAFQQKYPTRVNGIYIHSIRGSEVPLGQVAFSTAFDVSLSEVEKGNLLPEQAVRVGEAILEEGHPENLFPEFKYCPVTANNHAGPITESDPKLMDMIQRINTYTFNYCSHPQVKTYVEHPNEVGVIHITSDAMDGNASFKLQLDENQRIVLFRFVTDKNNTIDFNLQQLMNGAVVLTSKGIAEEELDVITLKGESVSPESGGVVKLIYLENGITKSKSEFVMKLKHVGSRWEFVVGDENRVFNAMFIKGKKLFGSWGKIIGIESVSVDWSDAYNAS